MKRIAQWCRVRVGSMKVAVSLLLAFSCSLTVFIVAGGSFYAYKRSLLDSIGVSRAAVLNQIGYRMRTIKLSANTISNLYYTDVRFQAYAQNLNEQNKSEFFDYLDRVTRQYRASFQPVRLDYSIVYLSVDGIGYCSEQVPDGYDYNNPALYSWYKRLYDAGEESVDIASFRDRYLGRNIYITARTIRGKAGEILGYFMVNIDERKIYETYAEVILPHSDIYIVDDNGDVISSSKLNVVGTHYFHMENLKQFMGGKDYFIAKLPERQELFTKYSDELNELHVFEEIPVDDILGPVRATGNKVIELAGGVLLFAVFLSVILTDRVTRSLLSLRDYVLRVGAGDLDAEFMQRSFSEVNVLSEGIARMLADIRRLMESERSKERQKRELQYQLLHAQINPHFMYNTLFSIKCLVDMNENMRASQMMTAFIQLLRGLLVNPDSLRTVAAQVESLKQYVSLQKFRYDDSFEVVFEYDEAVAASLLPALLIQPLIENAILHGFAPEKKFGMIVVSIREKHGRVVIEVEDNGIGMSAERKREVEAALEIKELDAHIGLRNIHTRIKMHFGESYGLKIQSEYGQGTKVVIEVPMVMEVDKR